MVLSGFVHLFQKPIFQSRAGQLLPADGQAGSYISYIQYIHIYIYIYLYAMLYVQQTSIFRTRWPVAYTLPWGLENGGPLGQ